MACSLAPTLGLDDVKLSALRRPRARPYATARPALTANGSSHVVGIGAAPAPSGAAEVAKLRQFIAAKSSPNSQGTGVAEEDCYYEQCHQQYLESQPPHGELGSFRARRHLRRRLVERPVPDAWLPAHQQEAQQPQQRQQVQQQQKVYHSQALTEQAIASPASHQLPAESGSDGRALKHMQQHAHAAGHAIVSSSAATASAAQSQLASLLQLSQQQLANLGQAARHVAQQRPATGAGKEQVSMAQQQQQRHIFTSATTSDGQGVLARLQQKAAALQQTAWQGVPQLSRKQRSAAHEEHVAAAAAAAVSKAQKDALVSRVQRQQLQQSHHQQQVQQRQVQQTQRQAVRRSKQYMAAAAPATPPPTHSAPEVGPVGLGLGRLVLGSMLAASTAMVLLLRWLRARRRKARSAQDAIREAEQRARAAKLYDRQRQRFQRALLAAEDLEGVDSTVFVAVGSKGSRTGNGAVPEANGAATQLDGAAAQQQEQQQQGGSNPFMREVAGTAAAAAALALATVDAEDAEGGGKDVFDPAGWDEDMRRQWESFVSSSKVNKGKLWDTSQVDEGLPEIWVDFE